MRTILYIILSLCSVAVTGQEISRPRENVLPLKTQKAFEAKAVSKVNEFFGYLELLTDPNADAEMKSYIRQQALALFKDGNVRMINFFNKKKDEITLTALLDLATTQKKKTTFNIGPVEPADTGYLHYTIRIAGGKTFINAEQPFIITEESKKFGTATRKVMVSYLLGIKEIKS